MLTSKPSFEFVAPVLVPGSDKANSRSIKVRELSQNRELTISFAKSGLVGKVRTDLSSSEKGKIDAFLNTLFDAPTLRRSSNKLKFQIEAESGNSRRDQRKTNVENELQTRFNALAPEIPFHPALDDTGVARKGILPLTCVNIDRSNHQDNRGGLA